MNGGKQLIKIGQSPHTPEWESIKKEGGSRERKVFVRLRESESEQDKTWGKKKKNPKYISCYFIIEGGERIKTKAQWFSHRRILVGSLEPFINKMCLNQIIIALCS